MLSNDLRDRRSACTSPFIQALTTQKVDLGPPLGIATIDNSEGYIIDDSLPDERGRSFMPDAMIRFRAYALSTASLSLSVL